MYQIIVLWMCRNCNEINYHPKITSNSFKSSDLCLRLTNRHKCYSILQTWKKSETTSWERLLMICVWKTCVILLTIRIQIFHKLRRTQVTSDNVCIKITYTPPRQYVFKYLRNSIRFYSLEELRTQCSVKDIPGHLEKYLTSTDLQCV